MYKEKSEKDLEYISGKKVNRLIRNAHYITIKTLKPRLSQKTKLKN